MAGNPITQDYFIRAASYGSYTLNEACDLMELADKYPTGNRSWNWVDVHSGKPVVIGVVRSFNHSPHGAK